MNWNTRVRVAVKKYRYWLIGFGFLVVGGVGLTWHLMGLQGDRHVANLVNSDAFMRKYVQVEVMTEGMGTLPADQKRTIMLCHVEGHDLKKEGTLVVGDVGSMAYLPLEDGYGQVFTAERIKLEHGKYDMRFCMMYVALDKVYDPDEIFQSPWLVRDLSIAIQNGKGIGVLCHNADSRVGLDYTFNFQIKHIQEDGHYQITAVPYEAACMTLYDNTTPNRNTQR